MITAHEPGLRATSTIMFGHIDHPRSWANHLEVIRAIQRRTGGFTEMVPLPFVHMGSPIFLRGRSRPGPTWDEVVLIHAVSRIALDGLVPNIQASWGQARPRWGAPSLERRMQRPRWDADGGDNHALRRCGTRSGSDTPAVPRGDRGRGRRPALRSTTYEILESQPR